MSSPHTIEQFNVENPPNIYTKRGSGFSSDSDNTEEEDDNTNDNIIFQKDSVDIRKNSKVKKGICGIRSDSEFTCILNIIVSAIGGGCFHFPFMMYEGGIMVILFVFLFVTGCTYYIIDLLRSFVVDTKYFSFALMTETILGSKWLKIYSFCSFVIYVSMVINYLTSIYVYFQGMLEYDNNLINILYFVITIILEIFICLSLRKMKNLNYLALVSFTSFCIITISLIIISIMANAHGGVTDKFNLDNLYFPKIAPKSFTNKLLKISSYIMEYVYGYQYHSTFPTVIGNLHTVNNTTTQKVHLISFGVIVLTYMIVTFFGFILSTTVPNTIFQENDKYFNGLWGADLRKPFKIVLIIYLLTLVPIRFIVIRDNYITLIGKKRINILSELSIIIIFVVICNIFVFGVGTFEKYFGNWDIRTLIQAFGGMFGVIISFSLPVVNYISVNGKKKNKVYNRLCNYSLFCNYCIFFNILYIL